MNYAHIWKCLVSYCIIAHATGSLSTNTPNAKPCLIADCIIFAYNTLLSLSRACIDKGTKKLGLKRSYASMLDKVGKMEGALKDQFHLAFSTLSTTLQMQMKPCNRYSHEFSAYYGSRGDFNHDGTPVKQKMQATLTTFFPSSQ